MSERMKINVLGSGTCVPSRVRRPCSILIRTKTLTILVDAGPGIMGQLLKLETGIDRIDLICLSHFHLDHCADVAPLLFATKYPGMTRKKPLTLMGGPGLLSWLDRISHAFDRTIDLPKEMFSPVELSGQGRLELDGLDLEYMPMAHRPESMGFRFTDSTGFSMVYSGDTDMTENLVRLASRADILVCESATPDGFKVEGHLTPSLAGDMATRAGVGKLVLTHFYPECEAVDMVAQCRSAYAGRIIAAEDLMAL